MNTKRKIQLAAAAIVANGALALTLLSPTPAMAVTCNDRVLCMTNPFPVCTYHASSCEGWKPAGCKVVSSTCFNPPTPLCIDAYKNYALFCNYEPA